jgi:phage minor structural protein
MLILYDNTKEIILDNTEYYVRELASGLDEIIFNISIWDPNYAILKEEANIVDRGGQRYLVKQIDAGAVTAKVVCQLDLDDWKATLSVGYDSGTKTVAQQVSAVLPTGWSVNDYSGSSIGRTIKGDLTPLQVCEKCRDTYGVYIRWDNKTKQCKIYTQTMGSPVGSFATRELNLKEINYKGKSNNFATRLYAYGKDGLSFASINSGKPYVDNHLYSSRVICAYWQDDRYTDKASLLDAARAKVAKLGVPERSYDCAIVDLQATNPEMYNNLDFSLFTVATLIDDAKDVAVDYQVVERHVWPYHPDRNDVIFNSSPVKIENTVIQIEDEITNPNSTFQQIWAARVAEATEWLTKGDGYVVSILNEDNEWQAIAFMDTPDVSTASDVLLINMDGIGFSHTGINGPYTSAWTIDGKFNADFILTGHMIANRIQGGVLESVDENHNVTLDLTNGILTMLSGAIRLGALPGGIYNFDVEDDGTLTIRKGSINLGAISGGGYYFSVDDNGQVTIKKGGISLGYDSGTQTYKFTVDNNGNLVANAATIKSTGNNGGSVKIENGTIESKYGGKEIDIGLGLVQFFDSSYSNDPVTMMHWDDANDEFIISTVNQLFLDSGEPLTGRTWVSLDEGDLGIHVDYDLKINNETAHDGSVTIDGTTLTFTHGILTDVN